MGKRAACLSRLLVTLISNFNEAGSPKSRRKTARGAAQDTTSLTREEERFIAEAHFPEIREYISEWSGDRNLDCLDLFGASGRVAETWKANGKAATSYDIKIGGKEHDITSRVGFFWLLAASLRLQAGALVVAGPPCSLFIFLSSSVHRRRKGREEGDTSNPGVRLANLIVDNMMVFLGIMHERGVYFVLEQPSSSWMFKLPGVLHSMAQIGNENIHRVSTWMAAFGHEMPKCTHLVGTLPTLYRMRRIHSPGRKQRKADKNLWEQTEFGVWGGRDLPGSAAYTPEFCQCLFVAWQRCRSEL